MSGSNRASSSAASSSSNRGGGDLGTMPTSAWVLRTQDEQWQAMATAGLITDRQQALVSRYDKQSVEAKLVMLDEEGDEYALTFVDMLHRISTPHTLQYMLALVDELLEFDESHADFFVRLHNESTPELPLYPFFAVMDRNELSPFVNFTATKILALLMSKATWEVDAHSVHRVVKWFLSVVHQQNLSQDHLLRALGVAQDLLRKDAFRPIFAELDGLQVLGNILVANKGSIQVQYQVFYCLWLLSYNKTLASKHFHLSSIIERIVDTLKSTTADKVIRTGVATLANLVGLSSNNEKMVERGFWKLLKAFRNRKWGDEDVIKDLDTLYEALKTVMQSMSSFDSYTTEVMSGDLCWSPVHKSDAFWRDNVTRFEDDKCRVLGLLVNLVKTTDNPEVLSVALHDVGEFTRYHPRGRRIMAKFPDVKLKIMELLKSGNDKVRTEALLACQKIMVQNWEYLGSKSNATPKK
eukprot:CAMPEP_0201551832 /NCGR_PEP_ID=MMETSP0173_2-20130828/10733_1 /ASSEMBLY_ACC=CAM_ASM_000268 /TAXON_ID=218659 /ORGANISM="Vexillifera sp., Strain DIVA3 564/2" /LENGTH=466 /DNA_ID=CAMNT_0047962181 /DNA_START=15 /DNA_END=1415 /DNA_ORIENTATION=+